MANPLSDATNLKHRTKQFALRIVRLVDQLPVSRTANHIGGQLLRCGTSVGANYRAACRARSASEFCAKMGIVEEEADESVYWMEMLIDAKLVKRELLAALIKEAHEIVSMTVASIQSVRRKVKTRNQKTPHSELRIPH